MLTHLFYGTVGFTFVFFSFAQETERVFYNVSAAPPKGEDNTLVIVSICVGVGIGALVAARQALRTHHSEKKRGKRMKKGRADKIVPSGIVQVVPGPTAEHLAAKQGGKFHRKEKKAHLSLKMAKTEQLNPAERKRMAEEHLAAKKMKLQGNNFDRKERKARLNLKVAKTMQSHQICSNSRARLIHSEGTMNEMGGHKHLLCANNVVLLLVVLFW
jgi:hypothetical protein